MKSRFQQEASDLKKIHQHMMNFYKVIDETETEQKLMWEDFESALNKNFGLMIGQGRPKGWRRNNGIIRASENIPANILKILKTVKNPESPYLSKDATIGKYSTTLFENTEEQKKLKVIFGVMITTLQRCYCWYVQEVSGSVYCIFVTEFHKICLYNTVTKDIIKINVNDNEEEQLEVKILLKETVKLDEFKARLHKSMIEDFEEIISERLDDIVVAIKQQKKAVGLPY